MMRHAVLALFVSSLLAPERAHAHGRPPFVERIAFDANDADRIVLSFSFGLIVSEDAGASWRWVCAAAYGVDATWEDPDLIVTSDGSIVLGAFDGAVRGARDLCSFERPGGTVEDTYVLDLARGEADTLWAVTSRGGGEPDRIQRSDDGGRSWAFAGEPVEALLQSVIVAPSDPTRVYVTAVVPATDVAPRRVFLLRSDDGGGSFTSIDIATELGEVLPLLVGVDPDDADRVFLRMTRDRMSTDPERLLVTDDGAATFRTALMLPQMLGFAITTDTVWVGSALGGVWRADASTLDFTMVSALSIRCLAVRGAELWMCVDEMFDGFSLGRSLDGGTTVETMLVLGTIEELPACPTCSTTAVTCPFWLDDLARDFTTYLEVEAPPPPMDASIPTECLDAGAPDAGARDAGARDAGSAMDAGPTVTPPGCGCRAGSGAQSPAVLGLVLALLALLSRRRGPP